MHILATSSASLDDLIEPVDLRQKPAEMVVLSFTDSDLASVAAAWRGQSEHLPSIRLAALRDLRHPMSVDLWIDSVARHAKLIVVRVLGGMDWWRYGCQQLSAIARQRSIALALLPGEGQDDDDQLSEWSTLDGGSRDRLIAYFRAGGPDNMGAMLRFMARCCGRNIQAPAPLPVPPAGCYKPGQGIVSLESLIGEMSAEAVVIPVLFYRSMMLAGDVAPIDALTAALAREGMIACPIFATSLRDPKAADFVKTAFEQLKPEAVVATTAFSVASEPGEETVFDGAGVPVLQAVIATTRREAWKEGARGLAPADLAMHVVLPELDGRIVAGAISFKDAADVDGLSFGIQRNRPEAGGIRHLVRRLVAMRKLRVTANHKKRLMVLIPDYPAAPGRTGYAVGLDVPASVLAMLKDLKEAGYRVDGIPADSRELMQQLQHESRALPLHRYERFFSRIPEEARKSVSAAWGDPCAEATDGWFGFRFVSFGNVTVALAPDRGRGEDRRADYHDPSLPPRHALLALGLWMRETLGIHAIVHVGAHGTLEWLPGKAVALTESCFPEIVTNGLPVIYPFIVSNPGEAAQAKRRIAAVTLGHLTPALVGAGLSPEQAELERLVDEFSQADGLDRRRRDRLAAMVLETAKRSGLATEAGIEDDTDPDSALVRIDAWLCDLKDFAIKDGLHVFGRCSEESGERATCGEAEKQALLDALEGRHIKPGPAGAPSRGRTDVLPTGRNLFTADPRTLPTPTATALGEKAAEEALRLYLQDHGEWPKSLLIDLWGSASLRTGGEEIAQGLALMGCRAQWDHATGRVTGIEVLPPARLGRPRVDVTWRISGLFRDMFPTQIALLDAAVRAVAERDEPESENPLAASAALQEGVPRRIFGSSPGTYGSGIEDKLASGNWRDRSELGETHLAATSYAYGGAEGEGAPAGQEFAHQVARADLILHTADDAGRDLLEGSADVAFVGGFAAAVEALGGKADLVILDTTDPQRPRARSLAATLTRIVRARALNPRFIAGQMRHGPRGASELLETVDRLVGFAETTNAVSPNLIEALFDAYLGDADVRAFMMDQNPEAAHAMAERFSSALRRGLWHPRRNTVHASLAALLADVTDRRKAEFG